MNDTIMASLAALKSRNKTAIPTSKTGLRAAQKITDRLPKKINHLNSLPKVSGPRTTVLVSLDSDVLKRLKADGGDQSAKIRHILRDYFKSRT